jgi:hypothetical protein
MFMVVSDGIIFIRGERKTIFYEGRIEEELPSAKP